MADYYDYSSDEEVIEFRRRNEEARKAREKARKQLIEESESKRQMQILHLQVIHLPSKIISNCIVKKIRASGAIFYQKTSSSMISFPETFPRLTTKVREAIVTVGWIVSEFRY